MSSKPLFGISASTPVNELPLDDELLVYFERMFRHGTLPATVGELMFVNEQQFLRRPRVGRRAVTLLRQLKAAISALQDGSYSSPNAIGAPAHSPPPEPSTSAPPDQPSCTVNLSALRRAERQALQSLIAKGVCDSSAESLLRVARHDLVRSGGEGLRHWHLLERVQARVREAMCSPHPFLASNLLRPRATGSLYSGSTPPDSVLETLLVDDFESFLLSLDPRDRAILTARLGYCRSQVTLQEAGVMGGFTRERARQIQVKFEGLLPTVFRLPQPTLHDILSRIPDSDVEERFPFLRSLFSSRRAFGEFLELVGDLPTGRLSGLAAPSVEAAARLSLKERFAVYGGPASVDELAAFLSESLCWTLDEARGSIRLLWKQQALTGTEAGLRPTYLAKKEAVAHVLARYPSGLPWQDLAVAVKASGVCRSEFPTDRLDQSTSDNDYLFLCGRGCYRHVKFFREVQEAIDHDLRLVRALLDSSEKPLTSLRAMYVANAEHFEHSYFELRHVLRTYGYKLGLHFTGRSGTDTVALSQINELASIVRQVQDHLSSSDRSFTAAELAETFGNVTAVVYGALVKLREGGRAVRVSRASYASLEVAFRGADVSKLEERARSLIESDQRPAELSWLEEQLRPDIPGSCSQIAVLDFLESAGARHGWELQTGLLYRPGLDLDGMRRMLDPRQWIDSPTEAYRTLLKSGLRLSSGTQSRLVSEHMSLQPSGQGPRADAKSLGAPDSQLRLLLNRI